jgi:pyruvate dehydrogenase E2 component (dihydrolipoamide acetyltransferase)
MATEFFIPKLGQTVEEVTIADWLVADGARVEKGQVIVEVETDKAVFPVEANGDGILHLGPFKVGDVVPVVTTVAIIGSADDRFEVKGSAEPEPISAPTAEATSASGSQPIDSSAPSGSEPEPASQVFASPRARMLAAEKNVDLSKVTPSGGQGIRIVEQDVLNYLSQLPKVSPVAQKMAAETGVGVGGLRGSGPGGRIMKNDVERMLQMESLSRQPAVAQPAPEGDILERVPLTGVRGIIAERMAASVHSTARVTLVMEIDATELAILRGQLKARLAEEWGFAPGYNDLLAKITAVALRKYPYMNARLTSDAIEYMRPINMGMAVDTERGLLVPVIHNSDQKNLHQFAQEFRDLVDRARNRKSLPDDLSGGTFTITSLGAFGVDAFTPVINLPEAAILGVGRIAEKVVPRDGQMVIRSMLTLSLVFDHRLVDGAPAARFLSYIRELIEEPHLLIGVL